MANKTQLAARPAKRRLTKPAERRTTARSNEPQDADPFNRSEQHQAKIDAIVAAAARLIHQKGVSGASLDDVAEALGVTKPSVYYYVKNKEELVYLCHLRISEHQAAAIDEALSLRGDGAAKIRLFIERYARFVWSSDSGLPRLWQDSSLSAQRRRDVSREYFRQSERLVKMIEAAIADGSIYAHDPEIVERALVSSILWVPIWYNEKRTHYDQDALIAHLTEIFFRGLRA